jgi:hypothetical protein
LKAKVAGLAVVKEKRKKNRSVAGDWATRGKWKLFCNFLSVDLNLKPRFEFKSSAFSNSNKLKLVLLNPK